MIYVTGDIHADTRDLYSRLEGIDLKSDDKIIICGDVGIKYGGRISRDLLWVMSQEYPCNDFIIMRGNHDDRYIRDMHLNIGDSTDLNQPKEHILKTEDNLWYNERYPNVYYVSDTGGLYHIENVDILFIPGAFSVDGGYRRAYHLPYEYQELLTKSEMNELYGLVQDYLAVKSARPLFVVSHTCPLTWEKYFRDLFFDGINQSEVDKSMEIWMNKVLNLLKGYENFCGWYFGHFHDDRDIPNSFGHMLFHNVVPIELASSGE